MNRSVDRFSEILIALLGGWIAAAIPVIADFVLKGGETDVVGFLMFAFLITGVLVIPCWLLLVLPLFYFLRPASDFWRYYISIPFGSIIGLIVLHSLIHGVWGAMPDYEDPSAAKSFGDWEFYSSALLAGGVTLGIASYFNLKELNPKSGQQASTQLG